MVTIDALQNQLEHAEGEYRLDLLTQLADLHQIEFPEKALDYANEALLLALELQSNKGHMAAVRQVCKAYTHLSLYHKAVEYGLEYLDLSCRMSDLAGRRMRICRWALFTTNWAIMMSRWITISRRWR